MRAFVHSRRCLRLLGRLAIVMVISAPLHDRPAHRWRDELVILELERLGVTCLLSREALREDLGRTGRRSQDYYFQRVSKRQNHFTPLGNEVVLREFYTWIAEGSR